eukprot:sb/3471592/
MYNRHAKRKQPIRTRYLGHVTGYQPIRDHFFGFPDSIRFSTYRQVPLTPRLPALTDSLCIRRTKSNWLSFANPYEEEAMCPMAHAAAFTNVSSCSSSILSKDLKTFSLDNRSIPQSVWAISPYRWTGVKQYLFQEVLVTLNRSISESRKPNLDRTRYLGHVTGYQPIRDQYFLTRSVPDYY